VVWWWWFGGDKSHDAWYSITYSATRLYSYMATNYTGKYWFICPESGFSMLICPELLSAGKLLKLRQMLVCERRFSLRIPLSVLPPHLSRKTRLKHLCTLNTGATNCIVSDTHYSIIHPCRWVANYRWKRRPIHIWAC